MSKKEKCIIVVEFGDACGARKPYALVVVDGSEFSRGEIEKLLERESSNPSRFMWMGDCEEETIRRTLHVLMHRYRRAKRKLPTAYTETRHRYA